ncbi:AI-2E family transporter [Novosphingopyxis sp. YJ-S2-01]|uniref:AI-2E family transporter n=1 Tax=Novosphingopyxis sp. YJ-S2-01 TaxID=2794021 RepID=UPI0018DDB051|nr:AI-2E family transporter [Novosphingopyxis sp. YJ-S2-01]MBH9538531.1 AI-2E family transporter [Novosphingopyxis sp. YJ-S2-01]
MNNLTKADIVRSTLIVLLLVGIAMLLVQVTATLMLIAGAILVAAVIRAFSDPLQHRGVPETLSVLLALIIIIALLSGFGYLFGHSLSTQFDNLGSRLTDAYNMARQWLASQPFGRAILSSTPDIQSYVGQALTVAFGAIGVITNLVLVIVGGIYLALDPGLYARGTSKLFPKKHSGRVLDALRESGAVLRRYLAAQLITMTAVGSLVYIGMLIVDIPSAGALGLISALTNFIPLIGPFIGAVPGILIAFADDPHKIIWAALVYLVAQQIEGNVLTPIVQRHAVAIPPAVLIFALSAMGTLFGTIGIVLAAPITVVIYTLVADLWSRETLGHEVDTLENAGIDDDSETASE